jgi:AraC-like DNA-binding protein
MVDPTENMEQPELHTKNLIPLMSGIDLYTVFAAGGHSPESIRHLCSLAGISENALRDPNSYLPTKIVWQLFSTNVAYLEDSLSGLGSQKLFTGATELVTARAMHEPTFSKAVVAFASAFNAITSEIDVRVVRRHGEIRLSVVFRNNMTPARQIFLEVVALFWHCTFCWLIGELVPVVRVSTSMSRGGVGYHLMGSFGCPVVFKGSGIELVYGKDVLERAIAPPPLSHWRSDVFLIVEDLIRAIREGVDRDGVVEYIQRAVVNGVSDQSTIAVSAGMSVATLRRRLADLGTSFRVVKEDQLAAQALLLIHQGKTVDEIAERLGYSEPRSFRRAFHRRFGESPSEYRSRLQITS